MMPLSTALRMSSQVATKLHNVIDLKGAALGKADLLETVTSFSLTGKDETAAKAEHFRFTSDEVFRDWFRLTGGGDQLAQDSQDQ